MIRALFGANVALVLAALRHRLRRSRAASPDDADDPRLEGRRQ